MPRYRENLSSFLNGEVSPKAYGRTELAQYKQSCEKIRNAVVLPQGGVSRRPGTQYKIALADSVTDTLAIVRAFSAGTFTTGNVKIIPFVISETESYVIVLGAGQGVAGDDGYPILIYNANNTAQKWIPRNNQNIASYINSTYSKPRWLPSTSDPRTIQYVQKGNVMFLSNEYMMPFAIEYTGDFTQAVGGASGGPFILRALETFCMLGKYPSISIPTEDIAKTYPFDTINATSTTTLTLSADGASGDLITITASAAGVISPSMVGCMMKITSNAGNTTGVYWIYAYNTGTNVANARIVRVGGNTVATTKWHRPQWFAANPGTSGPAYNTSLETASRWWPRSVTFYQNRLVFGGNTTYPATVWGSAQGNVSDFKLEAYTNVGDPAITNASAFGFEIAATEFASIRWLSSAKTLQVGTLGREYIGEGPDQSQSLGPLNVSFHGETNHGSALVQPIRSDNALVFIQRSGRKVREFTFNFAEDSYRSKDLTLFADHMPDITESLGQAAVKRGDGTIVEIAHQEIPNGITWMLDDYGGLIAMTRNREQEIVAFHHHLIGGYGLTSSRSNSSSSVPPGGTAVTETKLRTQLAEVRSICIVPSSFAKHDDLWMAVMRRLPDGFGSVETCFLEMIGKEFSLGEVPAADDVDGTAANYMIYSDCAVVLYNAGGLALTQALGAYFGNSVAVHVVGDGKYLGPMNLGVTGDLELTDVYKSLIVGQPFTTTIKPLNLEAGSAIGTSQGAMKRVDEVNIRFNRTIGAKFGPDEDNLQEIDFKPATLQDDPIPLYSDDQTLKFKGGHKRKAHVVIVQDLPLPLQVTSLVARLVEND